MSRFAIILLAALSPLISSATHLVGGEISYEYIGNDQYIINLIIYRDCGPDNANGTQFDNQAAIGIFDGSNTLIQNLSVGPPIVTLLPVSTGSPCLSSPPNICIEKGVYQTTVTLPPAVGGYTIAYQRCCRTPSVVNITSPGATGNTYSAQIPGIGMSDNSSPFFVDNPPLVICLNNNFDYNHAAQDLDGDSLVYSLVDPLVGGSSANPMPTQPAPPPYATVNWVTGYSSNYPIDASPSFSIHPSTGALTGHPTKQGYYAFAVAVREYRNGVLLSESVRDFRFVVVPCISNIVSAIADQTVDQLCGGLEITFNNQSSNATSFYWDFGDPNNINSTSNLQNPTYTYNDTGWFEVMLVAEPFWPCADTVYKQFYVREVLDIDFEKPDPQCLTGNSFDFVAQGNFQADAEFFWDFGAFANPGFSTDPNPTGITFIDSGKFDVMLRVKDDSCVDTHIQTVKINPEPYPLFSFTRLDGCSPHTVRFTNESFSEVPLRYLWSFGDGKSSTDPNPTITFEEPGRYPISLTIFSDTICIVQKTLQPLDSIIVYESPKSGFDINPKETTIYDPFVNVEEFSEDAYQVFYDFGGEQVSGFGDFVYKFTKPGNYYVKQTVKNKAGCYDERWIQVRVESGSVFVPNAFTTNEDDKNETFRAYGWGVKSFEMEIYNRWGELIFTSNSIEEAWNGKLFNTGMEVPSGTYIYQIKYTDLNDKPFVLTGRITKID